MKNKIILFLLLFFAVGLSAQGQTALVVELRDGSCASFLLAEQPKITFEGEMMSIVSSKTDMEFVRSEVKKYRFVDSVASIAEVEDASQATFDGNTLIVSGLSDETVVTVYTLSGLSVKKSTPSSGVCTISLESLPSALYIVNYNNTTIKILKK